MKNEICEKLSFAIASTTFQRDRDLLSLAAKEIETLEKKVSLLEGAVSVKTLSIAESILAMVQVDDPSLKTRIAKVEAGGCADRINDAIQILEEYYENQC